jgi:phosphorylcholine metabolism protein LicD
MFAIISILLYSAFIWKSLSAFIMIMFSLFEAFESQLAQYKTINQLISVNDYIYKKIRDNSTEIKEILSDDKTGNTFLRSLQDVIVNNRGKSLFIPKSIRLIYLKNGNPFYKQLDEIKQIYMKEPFIPEKAEDIDILSSSGENVIATVKDVHDHLRVMLKDVDKVFREANIKYLLDGGSLIGACRDDGFVFWDDDIDLAIMIDDVEKAKRIITEKLGAKYNVQDYENDDFYSPRLSNFRIREKNEISILEEKDSELYEKYNFRGLFIDVYAYTPIVVNKKIDSFLRKLLIQGFRFNIFGKTFSKGIYNRIRKEEAACKYDNTSKNKHELCFKKLKEKYLKRVKYYLKLTNNSEYYAYVPNYVEHLNAPGPYIKAESLFSTETQFNEINFEGINVTIPASPDDVLSAYYGNWKKSPFIGLNDLKDNEGNYKFSSKVFDATVLKHYKYINKLEEIKL